MCKILLLPKNLVCSESREIVPDFLLQHWSKKSWYNFSALVAHKVWPVQYFFLIFSLHWKNLVYSESREIVPTFFAPML